MDDFSVACSGTLGFLAGLAVSALIITAMF